VKRDLAFDRGFEIGLADLGDAGLDLVGDDDRPERAAALALSHDRMRIVSRAEASVISVDQQHDVHIVASSCGKLISMLRGMSITVISNAVAEFFLQLQEGGAIGHQRRIHRRFGREDRELVVGADHRAFDEQAVDAAGVLDGVGQAAARFQIERQRAGAEMHVEIEQRGRRLSSFAEQPGERGGDGRGAHAAARADDRHGEM
jgi:hypothetical protein